MKKTLTISILLAFYLSGCDSDTPNSTATVEPTATEAPTASAETAEGEPVEVTWSRVEPTPEERERAIEEIKVELIHPDSAEFEEIWFLSNGADERRVCGYFNAKDVHGSYTGKQKFYFPAPGGLFTENSNAGGFLGAKSVMDLCSD